MKGNKRLFSFAFLFVTVLISISCGKSQNIIGTWETEYYLVNLLNQGVIRENIERGKQNPFRPNYHKLIFTKDSLFQLTENGSLFGPTTAYTYKDDSLHISDGVNLKYIMVTKLTWNELHVVARHDHDSTVVVYKRIK